MPSRCSPRRRRSRRSRRSSRSAAGRCIAVKVRGRAGEVNVCEVLWRLDPDITEAFAQGGAVRRAPRLDPQAELRRRDRGDRAARLDQARPRQDERHGGEQHQGLARARAHLRPRRQLRDRRPVVERHLTSLIDGNEREVALRREEAVLGERGYIGLGSPTAGHGDHVLRYRLESRKP